MAKLIVLLSLAAYSSAHYSASNLARNIYDDCLSQYSVECVKPRTLQWISQVANNDEIKITNDLSIVRTATLEEDSNVDPRMAKEPTYAIFDKVDSFLQTHTLRVKVPEEITKSAASEYVPRSLLFNLPSELDMPLDGEEEVDTFEGRKKKIKLPKPLRIKSKHGFIKKVILPFLLGLKFKTAVLVPLALALIALKTWKALTLGLISIVLSGAMVIFKFTKPKVVNYEVIHYPQHHVEHHVDHHAPAWDSHGPYQARSYEDAHDIAYSGQI
ncbi:Osiris 18 [Operophtera brumata]|uniref:Osiris 18 n=1 Tax=Operophtera brumata TaxID=104452 RepID=A0A0L7L6D8_OPEBR|nr:Osiris 18 [Operophtera brumata]